MEIIVLKQGSKWALTMDVYAILTPSIRLRLWSHSLGRWVRSWDEAAQFETEAAALVYRRGNLQRMLQIALKDSVG